jgi:hypothetical protein
LNSEWCWLLHAVIWEWREKVYAAQGDIAWEVAKRPRGMLHILSQFTGMQMLICRFRLADHLLLAFMHPRDSMPSAMRRMSRNISMKNGNYLHPSVELTITTPMRRQLVDMLYSDDSWKRGSSNDTNPQGWE